MISLATAQALKELGLDWTPRLYDFFVLPDRGLDDQVFVISDVMVNVEKLYNEQLISFNGAAEWALDYILTGDAVWMPSEAQLRELLEQRVLMQDGQTDSGAPLLSLSTTRDGYRCTTQWRGETRHYEAFGAGEAYAAALKDCLMS